MREQAQNKYKEFSEKSKDIKRECGVHRYRSISGQDKQKSRCCQKNSWKKRKNIVFFYVHYIRWVKRFRFFVTGLIEIIFHKCKHPIDINNVDISKLLMSDKRWILDTKVMMVLDH